MIVKVLSYFLVIFEFIFRSKKLPDLTLSSVIGDHTPPYTSEIMGVWVLEPRSTGIVQFVLAAATVAGVTACGVIGFKKNI